MKFSVLMSVYIKEQPDSFESSLESILINQTVIPDEFVLICDGPLTDELNKVIERFCTEFPEIMKIHRLEKNVGLGQALNIGLEKCSNEIIARADSDDVCVPERFARQLEYITAHPEAAAVGSGIDEFDTDWNNPIYTKHMPQSFAEIKKMNRYRNPLNHMTVMFRKSMVMQAGSYMPLPYVEDYYLWVRLIACGYELANMSDILVHARIGNGMLKRRANKQYISSWKVLNKYKLEHGQINRIEYAANWILVRLFVYEPQFLRKMSYRTMLRNKREENR